MSQRSRRRLSEHSLEPTRWQAPGPQSHDNSAPFNAIDMTNRQHSSSPFSSGSQQNGHGPSTAHYGPDSNLLHHPISFLSPDAGFRRAKSDAANQGRLGHRLTRSDDFSPYPPSPHLDMLQRQYLHPKEPVNVPNIRGHRRSHSGERGVGSWSPVPSARPSPYPSPHVSPRGGYDELPNVSITGQADMRHINDMLDPYDPLAAGNVSKPNVTTGRTANASHKRRKQPANFVCPIPGCGSTFTRSFNLKGVQRVLPNLTERSLI